MISEEEALAKILAATVPLDAEAVDLLVACGRFSAGDLFAAQPLPGFDNSAMDGYAVRAGDCTAAARLRITGEQPAGLDLSLTVGAGECVRIFTGAPMPRGATAVIMQEDVRVEDGCILIRENAESGEFIRHRGCDLTAGQRILEKGERITAQSLALLASQGWGEVQAGRAPRVAILSTGDELVAPGQPPASGQIYESNGLLLAALVHQTGASTERLGIAPDEPGVLRNLLQRGLQADALIVSGGVSVGERDLVKAELAALGAHLDLWRVAIKPGKPFVFGQHGGCKIFGLPGNPVSAFVTFLQFVRPALLKMMGARDLALPSRMAATAGALSNSGDRPHYLRGKLEAETFFPVGLQQSHALFGLSRSNALVRVAPGENFAAGALVRAYFWD